MKAFASALLICGLIAAPALAQDDNSVTVRFDVGAATGAVMVGLYDSAAAYGNGQPVRGERIATTGGAVTVAFDHLPAGDYAFKAYHDVNGDGQLNTNPFGMPTEPYAFSNNAVGHMGPAGWDAAHFTVRGPVVRSIRLR
jgi:uncharacterized protein (DUF2141 family)